MPLDPLFRKQQPPTMPRFEISDGAIMALNGIAAIADGAHALIAPQHFEVRHQGQGSYRRVSEHLTSRGRATMAIHSHFA